MSVLRDYATALTQPRLPLTAAGDDVASGRFDEAIQPDGGLRPGWKRMAEALVELTPAELGRVDEEIGRFIADDGVTYANRGRSPRAWQLDPVPLVIDPAEWERLEVGLAQRAELLNALLADLYGERRMLAEGVIPAAAILGHAGYTRALAGPGASDRRPLTISGTDLGRDAQGEWRVLADRVQAPSGLGYAMENRRVISRVLPELYQEAGMHRLEPYFSALRETLLSAAPAGAEDPRVVVLSPGIHSETAYDQAFLANLLGFLLVQGDDLVVRDGAVWIKPPGWPETVPSERVDVILRRIDPEWCDPLELRGDSQLGVAGLVEAARRGRVRIVNGLGAGVLENTALHAFMPAVCEALLGEQLRLPSTPAWWCGDPHGLDTVLRRLKHGDESLIVRCIDGSRAGLAGSSPRAKAARIAAEPHRYVALERLPLSQAPVWDGRARTLGAVAPRPVVLRTFTLDYRAAYRPLLGGIATVSRGEGGEADEPGLLTKDVWVLKAAPEDVDQGLVALAAPRFAPTVPGPAPRALDDLFWAGRYAERVEDLMRLVLDAHARLLPPSPLSPAQFGAGAVELMGALQRLAGRWYGDPREELRSLLLDAERVGGAAQSLEGLRDALEGVRDQLSGDTWRVFGEAERALRALRESTHSHQIQESAGRVLAAILAFQGVTASMIRDSGWHLIEIGRFLERALQLCSLLEATTTIEREPDVERQVLEGVLAAAESAVTYRRRYRGDVRTAGVLELLLTDADNPRSLVFALDRLREHLAALPLSTGSTRPERLLDELADDVALLDVAELVAAPGGERTALDGFLGDASAQLAQLAEAIAGLHLAGGPPRQPISAQSLIEVMSR